MGTYMTKKTGKKKKFVRRVFSTGDEKELRLHAKLKTPIPKIALMTGRTEGSIRQKAIRMGLPLPMVRQAASKSADT